MKGTLLDGVLIKIKLFFQFCSDYSNTNSDSGSQNITVLNVQISKAQCINNYGNISWGLSEF